MFKWIKKLVTKWALEAYEERVKKYVPTTHSEMNDSFMYDFRRGWLSGNSGSTLMPSVSSSEIQRGKEKKPLKIAIKPIDVVNELETAPNACNLTNIEDKIDLLNQKKDLIAQEYARRHVEKLIERLENRKKYPKFAKFFSQFQDTTEEKIDKLLEKYDLVMQSSELFVPSFPREAIKIMSKYTKNVKEVCGKDPNYYVIADKQDFSKKDERLDPILLVQSPFGFYYQILGAWDKEMLLLSEL